MIRRYARFVSNRPVIMLVLILVISLLAFKFSQEVGTKSMENEDTLPDDIRVIEAFDKIENNFGGSDSILLFMETDPETPNSDEIRDMYDPRAIEYSYVIGEMAGETEDVISADSAGSLMKRMNNNVLPKSKNRVKKLAEESQTISQYISEDRQSGLVRISLSETYEEKEIVNALEQMIRGTDKPPGLDVKVAGDVATQPIIEKQIGPDMQKTSRFSFIGILIVLLLLFMSVRYAVTPLIVIGLGIMWAFGYFGIMGTEMSPATSGAISMIMGIGIDFGIQTITRYRQEKKKLRPRKAMENTVSAVFMPMATTTLAALIGFQAMSMGELSIMGELATIMSYGVAFCFLSAITVIPVLTILTERRDKK